MINAILNELNNLAQAHERAAAIAAQDAETSDFSSADRKREDNNRRKARMYRNQAALIDKMESALYDAAQSVPDEVREGIWGEVLNSTRGADGDRK